MPLLARASLATAAVLLVTAGLAGCTTSPAASERSERPSASPSVTADDATPVIDPLSAYVQVDWSRVAERRKKQEESVRECMKGQGFEYTVVEAEQPKAAGLENFGPELNAPSREYVAEHGELRVETYFPSPGDDSWMESDPNDDYFQGLSASEQTAYMKAMHGRSLEPDVNTLSTDETGCNGKVAAAFAQDPEAQPPIIDEAKKFVASLREHPKITAILDDLGRCLTDQGYSRRGGSDIATRLDDYKAAYPWATSEDPGVRKLKKEEIDAALAVWGCKADVEYAKRTLATLTELETNFITEHQKELEEARLWLDQ